MASLTTAAKNGLVENKNQSAMIIMFCIAVDKGAVEDGNAAPNTPIINKITIKMTKENKLEPYVNTVEVIVRFVKLEKNKPNEQKKTAVTTSINVEMIISAAPTPPRKNARLCTGMAVKISSNK